MFDSYTKIFDRRGEDYHRAMRLHPQARNAEFQAAVDLLELESAHNLCDVPSGGGYLSDVLSAGTVSLSCVETSGVFAREISVGTTYLCDSVAAIPLENHCFDRVLSLAGVHHLDCKESFYREVSRLLKPDTGIFVLSDVFSGSGVDGFLNTFVNQHSSMGHQGEFLTENTVRVLKRCGFRVLFSGLKSYRWQFPSVEAMVEYCQLMFGIDEASPERIVAGISEHLGYVESDAGCDMNWQLYFIQAAWGK